MLLGLGRYEAIDHGTLTKAMCPEMAMMNSVLSNL